MIFTLLFCIFAGYHSYTTLSKTIFKTPKTEEVQPQQEAKPQEVQPKKEMKPPAPEYLLSERWRIAGELYLRGFKYAILKDRKNNTHIISLTKCKNRGRQLSCIFADEQVTYYSGSMTNEKIDLPYDEFYSQ